MAKFSVTSNGYTTAFQLPPFTKLNWVTVGGLAVDVTDSGDWAVLTTPGTNGQVIEIDYQPENGYITAHREKRISALLKLLPNPGSQALAAQNTTGVIFNTQLPAIADFFGVKLVFQNYDTVNSLTFDGVKVAPAAYTAGAGGSQNNSALTFSPFVTFNGSQTVVLPPAVTGTGGQVIPSVAVSDFVRVKSIPRTDFPTAPRLLRVAAHQAPSANGTVHPSFSGAAFTSINVEPDTNKFNFGNNTANDTLANLTSVNSPTWDIYGGIMNPVGAYFYYSTGVQEVAFFGDSILQGVGSLGNLSGFPAYLTWLTYGTKHPFSAFNCSASGQKTEDSLAVAKSFLSKSKPAFAVFKSWSPNDGSTQANFDAAWGNTLEFVDYCIANGIIPIVMDNYPIAGTSNTLIKAQNARVAGLPPSVLKFETFSLIASVTNDTTHKAEYYVDGTHVNSVASKALAQQFIKTLSI